MIKEETLSYIYQGTKLCYCSLVEFSSAIEYSMPENNMKKGQPQNSENVNSLSILLSKSGCFLQATPAYCFYYSSFFYYLQNPILAVTCNVKAGRTALLWVCWCCCWVLYLPQQCWTSFNHVQNRCNNLFMVGSVYFTMKCIILSASISRNVKLS